MTLCRPNAASAWCAVRSGRAARSFAGQLVNSFEDFLRLSRQGHDMVLVHLHLGGRNSPARLVPIDFDPLRIVNFAWSHGTPRSPAMGCFRTRLFGDVCRTARPWARRSWRPMPASVGAKRWRRRSAGPGTTARPHASDHLPTMTRFVTGGLPYVRLCRGTGPIDGQRCCLRLVRK
jgi:hypothetical protein